MALDGSGGGGLALGCTGVCVFLGYQAVTTFPGWEKVGSGLGLAVLGIGGVLLLWWLFGESRPSGLQLARRTVGRLEQEAASRNRTLAIAWILFGATGVLVVVMMLGGLV